MPSKPSSCASYVVGFALQALGFDPGDAQLQIVRQGAVDQRLFQRFVTVLVLDVLADDADGDFVLRVVGSDPPAPSTG